MQIQYNNKTVEKQCTNLRIAKKDFSDRDILNMLLEAIDYSFLRTDGTYNKELTYPVIDKVRFIKKVLKRHRIIYVSFCKDPHKR